LAAYGGAAVAFDLALDLVLNEVVEQARIATGATGAAIALARDGEMECRATTGKDAPDLGVRVETESGLSGECLRTREVQNCTDTEVDPRVDAEACRQLGVRSMLILPLSDDEGPFGILEVLSSTPNAFNERHVRELQVLAARIVASKNEAEHGANNSAASLEGRAASVEEEAYLPPLVPFPSEGDLTPSEAPASAHDEPEPPPTEIWTTVLVVLIIAVAVVLGVLIGWRSAANRSPVDSQAGATNKSVDTNVPAQQIPDSIEPSSESPETGAEKLSSSTGNQASVRKSTDVPPGGLIVTENGKVIYRALPPAEKASAKGTARAPAGQLIHRVEPDYPAQAKNRNVEGPVVLDVQVLSNGRVGTIGIVSGDPILTESAVQAVRQWRYQPYLVNGRPVEGQTRIRVNFTLPRSN
jgi:TonB family protein